MRAVSCLLHLRPLSHTTWLLQVQLERWVYTPRAKCRDEGGEGQGKVPIYLNGIFGQSYSPCSLLPSRRMALDGRDSAFPMI